MATTNATTKTVSQGKSRYGTSEPQIEVLVPGNAGFRIMNATLHMLAAEVEWATPGSERWIVQLETSCNGRGRVYLELADGTPEEAERGLAILRTLVG